jgi:hypothetical protein
MAAGVTSPDAQGPPDAPVPDAPVPGAAVRRRVSRLLGWYPRPWRERYGEEFSELLGADLCERPHAWRRSADVAWCGVAARLRLAGMSGPRLGAVDQVRASMVVLAGAIAVFLVAGVATWSQVTVGWQWSAPDSVEVTTAMVVMTVAVFALVAVVALAAVPIVVAVGRAGLRRHLGTVAPAVAALAGMAALVVGGRHFANGWPGTGGHPWALQGLVPGGVAAFGWSSTLAVTSYWAHPGALATFPAPELAWMAASPVAMAGALVGTVRTVRRVQLSARVLRYEAVLGAAAAVCMTLFMAGAACWVTTGVPGPRHLFKTGAIDPVELVVMAGAVLVAWRAATRARRGGPAGAPCPALGPR